jgi:transposase
MSGVKSGTERTDSLPVLRPQAAGLDIGRDEIWVAVPEECTDEAVRCFATYTPDLHALADWLAGCGIKTVAMESTGVYWIPIHEILEARGFEVYLVNARHIKGVPGRKSDVQDCRWIQRLHSFGLLNGSFRPEAEMCTLRAYLRHRAQLVEHRAAHIQHMQKALQQMNVQLAQVVSDITGVTGMGIIRAIVRGERDPQELARYRTQGCARTQSEIAKALTGHYQEEHVFVLKQALELYDFYTQQMRECDEQIERRFAALKPIHEDDLPPLDRSDKHDSHSKNGPAYDARGMLYQLLGVDLGAIPGLNGSTLQVILSETGTDMSRFRTDKHFCSWLGLAPHNDISGGKVLRSRVPKTHNRAGQAFRLAAQSVSRGNSAYGAFLRRMRAKHGPKKAVVATAHKIARTFYYMLKYRIPYEHTDAETYDQRARDRQIVHLRRKAAQFGLSLVDAPLQPAMAGSF